MIRACGVWRGNPDISLLKGHGPLWKFSRNDIQAGQNKNRVAAGKDRHGSQVKAGSDPLPGNHPAFWRRERPLTARKDGHLCAVLVKDYSEMRRRLPRMNQGCSNTIRQVRFLSCALTGQRHLKPMPQERRERCTPAMAQVALRWPLLARIHALSARRSMTGRSRTTGTACIISTGSAGHTSGFRRGRTRWRTAAKIRRRHGGTD